MRPELKHALQAGEKLGLRYTVQAPQNAMTGLSGAQLGRRPGSSIDFQDYREYQPGDDLRFIDWGVYARTDRLTVKMFREEVTPHLDLIIDGSKSMNLETTVKGGAAATLAGLLAAAAANAQFTHAAWLSGEGFARLDNDSHSPSSWDGFELGSTRTIDQAFEILSPRFRRLGVRALISDLLWPGNPVQTVRRLSEGAAALFVIQLLARDDAHPPSEGNIRLEDSETGELTDIYIDASITKRYRDNLAQHQQAWENACRQCGARLATIIAEDLEQSLTVLEEIQLLGPA
jgi:uncharacterized protein (DUF58 family)